MKPNPADSDRSSPAEALLALCRRPEAGRSGTRIEDRPPTVNDVERLLESASDRSVMGLALSSLLEAGLALEPSLREELKDSWAGHRRRARVWILERDRVAGALADVGLEPVVLKGAALCTEWYAEPAHREFGDIDLLVAEERLERALSVLRDAGYRLKGDEEVAASYRRHHFHYRLSHPTGFVVELHWGLSRPGGLFPLEPRAFLERSRPVEGRSFRIPSPEHMLLHCVHQSLATGRVQLRRLVDVDRVVGGAMPPDGDRLAEEAARCGLGHAVWLALTMSRGLLGTDPGDVLVPRLRPGPVTRAHLRLLDLPGAAFDRRHDEKVALSHLLRLWLLSSAGARLRYLAQLGGRDEDPLAFVWEKAEGAGPPGTDGDAWRGLGRLTKLATAQLLVYGAAPFGGVRGLLAR